MPPTLTRRRIHESPESWHIPYDGVVVGTIGRRHPTAPTPRHFVSYPVGLLHPKATPVILTPPEECNIRPRASG
jgi:hypothetical protein